MNVIIDLQQATDADVPSEQQFQRWASAALAEVNEDCELTIRLVDETESAELNNDYRGKNYPTNVLSFPFESPVPLEPVLLGDLVLCVPVVEREAAEQEKTTNDHWAHLIVHGCLHLLGYDHIEDDEAELMESLEIKILQKLDINNPYTEQRVTS
ncbi:rRNA maturation RNase YbeY [Methylophaga nitratireducenticrescens]|uniref:Endoribonuclease YbeY n=1 Tax=Methylophaga nitratireducenticrescens TaxID=754476 RepID=I1XEW8_METNJ|nr:rRNA maturation RNase YbeY [Methylophaga nitratireducenticrescens]AFI82937.1 rRNA maturation RNase YbeY [Methylophaga nitratireducenticrescens]AUZ83123.1 rRNA maturation RNase YbeY [Methylophaga nitratireducenticrescens]